MATAIMLLGVLAIGVCIGLIAAPRVEIVEANLPPTFHCNHLGCDKYMVLVPIFKNGKHTGHSQYYCPDGHTGIPKQS